MYICIYMLDLVFSTDSSKLFSTASTEISKIDLYHPPLQIFYQVDSDDAESQINHCYYDFKNIDFVKLNSKIEENFNHICLISVIIKRHKWSWA